MKIAYQNPSYVRWWQKRPARRTTVLLVLTTIGILIVVEQSRIAHWWTEQQCCTYSSKDEMVAFEIHCDSSNDSGVDGDYQRSAHMLYGRRILGRELVPLCWRKLLLEEENHILDQPPDSTVFLHERISKDGRQFIVHVGIRLIEESHVRLQWTAFEKRGYSSRERGLPASDYIDIRWPASSFRSITAFLGVPNAGDSSTFSLRFNVDGTNYDMVLSIVCAPGTYVGAAGMRVLCISADTRMIVE
jgi:hypothetical protein